MKSFPSFMLVIGAFAFTLAGMPSIASANGFWGDHDFGRSGHAGRFFPGLYPTAPYAAGQKGIAGQKATYAGQKLAYAGQKAGQKLAYAGQKAGQKLAYAGQKAGQKVLAAAQKAGQKY
jgi:hypothetical protein